MSEFEPTEYDTFPEDEPAAAEPVLADDVATDAASYDPAEDDFAEVPRRRRRRWPLVLAAIVVVLFGLSAGFYFLGAPSQGQTTSENGQAVPPADPNSPLAISIPGCVCHSDDPKLVASHKEYRMNQCAGCHKDGTPAMGAQ